MQGAQKLRSEAHLRVRRNDEVAAQRRRWTFYETINISSTENTESFEYKKSPSSARLIKRGTRGGFQQRHSEKLSSL
jgi:hypothetical protein